MSSSPFLNLRTSGRVNPIIAELAPEFSWNFDERQ